MKTAMLILLLGAVGGAGALVHPRTPATVRVSGADVAEWFQREQEVKPGDVIGLDLTTGKVRPHQDGDLLVGICTDTPGIIGNSGAYTTDEEMARNYALVAVLGQVKVNPAQAEIVERRFLTTDGEQIGYKLANGKVMLKMR